MARSSRKPPLRAPRRECDLSAPIQQYLAAQGYTVRCEVGGCDITAMRGDELVIVEMKRQFSTDLLIQAIDRQRVCESVYVALPNEGDFDRGRARRDKRWRGIEALLKRLELGLIVVGFSAEGGGAPSVDIVRHPVVEARPRAKSTVRRSIVREIAGRMAGDFNVGGSTRRTLVTAYREQAIYIACCLERHGALSPARLRNGFGASAKTQTILADNLYGWFERRSRGIYGLRPNGRESIAAEYSEIAAFYVQRLNAVGIATDAAGDAEAIGGTISGGG